MKYLVLLSLLSCTAIHPIFLKETWVKCYEVRPYERYIDDQWEHYYLVFWRNGQVEYCELTATKRSVGEAIKVLVKN